MIIHNGSAEPLGGASCQSPQPPGTANFVWIVILALACVAGSFVLSCVMPFVALAVALACTIRLGAAVKTMAIIWLTNQFVGFVFLHYPRTSNSVLWGLAIGMAALLSTLVASMAIKRAAFLASMARLVLAFLLSYAVYEIALGVAGLFLGSVDTFSPAIIAQLAFVNFVWLVGLIVLNELVVVVCKTWIGMPPRLGRVQ